MPHSSFRAAHAAIAAALLLAAAAASPPVAARSDLTKPLSATHPCQLVGRYCLQSNPWVNLHQRLLHEARFGSAAPTALAGAQLGTWNDAVGRYRRYVGERDPVFDAELVALNAALSRTKRTMLPDTIPAEPRAALESAMPHYLRAQWKSDNRANQFYIAYVIPMLVQAGGPIIAAHEDAYGIAFPSRILVDVTGLAWEFGAYAVGEGDEVHVVQSSTTPLMQGFGALESLVHEPSHAIVNGGSGAIGSDLARAAAATKVQPRDNLWHAMMFYTTGALTRRALARRGIDYVPAITHRYDGPFAGMRKPLETHWQAYLDGELSRDEAVRRVLVETRVAAPKR